jgi:ubiquinone/menaquinone biosynthesis C-methylase UbiE
VGIEAFFRPDTLAEFDFSLAPRIVRRARSGQSGGPPGLDLAEWERAQARFLARGHEKSREEEMAAVRESAEAYDRFFRERGPLRGNVLDIGGSAALYRQWWEPGESGVYVVHDPAPGTGEIPERYRLHYPRAFTLTATFVEGLGEDLPYYDGVFDTCFMVAALDHCADPARVLAEAWRCLAPGGEILILQTCRLPKAVKRVRYAAKLVWRDPLRLLEKLRRRLQGGHEKHMHRFDVDGLAAMLKEASFVDVRVSGPVKKRVFAFGATKPQSSSGASTRS